MRKALLLGTLCVAMIGCGGARSASTATDPTALEAAFPGGTSQLVHRADEMPWRSCPASLPAGCEMAVLEGDPREPMLFTVRFRTGDTFELPPHWHPRNERVTILEGRVGVGFGDVLNREQVTWFGPGDYYVNAKGAHHFVLADGPAVLQVTGIGPWQAILLETEP